MLTKQCIAITNYIIEETEKFNKDRNWKDKVLLSDKRMQRLLYLCEAEYMRRNNGQPLFDDEFCAWPTGPAIVGIYCEFKYYQDGTMCSKLQKENIILPEKVTSVIDEILESSKDLDAIDLCNICTVPGGPHSKVFKKDDREHKQIISKKDTYLYYSKEEIISQLKQDKPKILSKEIKK